MAISNEWCYSYACLQKRLEEGTTERVTSSKCRERWLEQEEGGRERLLCMCLVVAAAHVDGDSWLWMEAMGCWWLLPSIHYLLVLFWVVHNRSWGLEVVKLMCVVVVD